jgi:hypothetical protein
MKAYDGSTTTSYPIYDSVENNAKMGTSAGEIPLVDSTSPLASKVKV